ncbi:hypothetical protein [Pseudomonas gingeri]|uniref:hypothetical protein n=1 Tax=Pseudomonas gingeri TaxID=117681 RepID=UPI001C4357DF|nr:hypothetical protein [Pseudomonas gingeri]
MDGTAVSLSEQSILLVLAASDHQALRDLQLTQDVRCSSSIPASASVICWFEESTKKARLLPVIEGAIIKVNARAMLKHSDVSRTILSQCNNFLALRLTNDVDQNVIKRLMPDSLAGLTSVLPLLDTGEALMRGDAVLLPSRIKLDLPSITPDSATRDFWKDWGSQAPDIEALANAVESLRSQTKNVDG